MTMKFTGDKAVARMFKKLPSKLQKKHTRKALREGAKIIQHDARVLAPKGPTWATVESIAIGNVRVPQFLADSVVKVKVGLPIGAAAKASLVVKSKSKKGYLYPAAHEVGAASRNITARSFLAKAADRNWRAAVACVIRSWRINVVREARRLVRGGKR